MAVTDDIRGKIAIEMQRLDSSEISVKAKEFQVIRRLLLKNHFYFEGEDEL
jgi:hypothetical protein